ncbi:MAG: TolC family protein, partial [Planctomycetota bacterium]
QLAVDADLISRVQRRLSTALKEPVRIELLSTGIVLIDRLLAAIELRDELGMPALETRELTLTRSRLLVDASRESVLEVENSLRAELDSPSPSLPVIFQRTLALSRTLQELLARQFELAQLMELDAETLKPIQQARQKGIDQVIELAELLQAMIENEQMQTLPVLVEQSQALQLATAELVNQTDQLLGIPPGDGDVEKDLQITVTLIEQLLNRSAELLKEISTGLSPIQISVDDAMVTALLLRFDLMNQRGFLADDLRQIKLAADDLRSILNLSVSQRIGTDSSQNNPVNFDFEDSQTALQVTFDAPLNRQAQRNAYRNSLINYQAGIRDLGGLEDTIKFSVRNDLRNLALDREQYLIAVASAALAFERVVSTSLEFRLGTGGVSARDFLEAQTAYTDALSAVASRRIDYIVDRTQLFLDMELLTVDSNGFWEPLYEVDFQPDSYFEFPDWARPIYGDLPCVNYSNCVRDPLNVPVGPALNLKPISEPTETNDNPDP